LKYPQWLRPYKSSFGQNGAARKSPLVLGMRVTKQLRLSI